MEKHPPLHIGVVAIEKGAFGLPSTKVANFTYIYIRLFDLNMHINVCLCMCRRFAQNDAINFLIAFQRLNQFE